MTSPVDLHANVISICSSAHTDVWRLTSRLLLKFVTATNYEVFVPDQDVDDLKRETPSQIRVVSQHTLGHDYQDRLFANLKSVGNLKRFGWYLQQFYKIEAILKSDQENLVIWDADCVPTATMRLFDSEHRPVYMAATESHAPYFDLIMRVLGLPKVHSYSFVIPGFPVRRSWVEEMCTFISFRNGGVAWYDVLLDQIDFRLPAGFSETETMGTWITHAYPEAWTTSNIRWERFGRSQFGAANVFDPESIVALARQHDLEIISFENWDTSKTRRRVAGLVERFNTLARLARYER